MKRLIYIISILVCGYNMAAAQIIDMHLHGYTEEDYWGGKSHPTGVESPKSAEEHLNQTIQLMDEHNIDYAMVSGSIKTLEMWTKADPRLIPGYQEPETGKLPAIDRFEKLVKSGKIKIFGEITAVYRGRTLNDPIYQPYLKICEEYGIPVAYHTGGGPPMTPYQPCCPNFRIALGDPLLIEDVLVRYPDLKIYLMHGGEVFFEHAVRMMSLYRQLYIDLGVLLWVEPIVKDYAVRLLKLAKTAGVLDRVMFGSDQMVWPGAISRSIDFLNSMEFLTENEKEMILYENAREFLGIEQ